MFSFKSLAVFSTLAFGALSVMASPVLNDVHNNEVETKVAPVVVARCDTCSNKSIVDIMAGVTADIQVDIATLHGFTAETCTPDAVAVVVGNIKVALSGAIVEVKALAGASAEVILGGGVEVTVDVIAKVVADLCILIFGAIGVVLNLGLGASLTVILPILCGLGEVVGALVCAVLSVCGHLFVGLDVAIFALIKVCLAVIVKLNVSILISVFGIVL